MKEKILLKRIALIPSFRCNLKCQRCISGIPKFSPGNDMSMLEVEQTLKMFFSIVDSVELLQISGGEPLLYKELSTMISTCFKYSDRFEKLMVFTNGTIPLRDEVLNVINQYKDRFVFFISNYGMHAEMFNLFIKTLEKNSVTYKMLNYYGNDQYFGGWVDFGEYAPQRRTPAELVQIFHSCGQVQSGGCWQVRNGQIHWCPRSLRGTLEKVIPSKKNIDYIDYIDIFDADTTLDEKCAALNKLIHTDYFLACDYCTGDIGTTDTAKRYPAAEQKN